MIITTGDEDGMAAKVGKVEPFNPGQDDWLLYTECLEQFFIANEMTEDKKKVATLLTAIGATGYALLRSLVAPTKPGDKKYDKLVKTMKDHLNPKPIVIAERFKFYRRNQGEGETVAQYVAKLRWLTEHCEFKVDYVEEAIRDRLVCGLKNEAIQQKLLTKRELTLTTAYNIAHGMETAIKEASKLQASARADESAAVTATDVHQVVGPSLLKPCYRYSRTRHTPDICYYKGQHCRRCKKKGHIARMCKEPQAGTRMSGGPRSQSRPRPEPVEYIEKPNSDDDDDCHNVNVATEKPGPIMVASVVNGKRLPMELDTGASVSIVSYGTVKEIFPNARLVPSEIMLRTYSGEHLKVEAEMVATVKYGTQTEQLTLIVVEGNGPLLLGRNWLAKIHLDGTRSKVYALWSTTC